MQRRGSLNGNGANARIRVAVRVRPPNAKIPKDETRPPCVVPLPHANTAHMIEYRHETHSKAFTFDHVFETTATQEDVYTSAVQPLMAQFLDGYNVTVMAYGQTGSGKTYTMGNKVNVFNTTPTTSPCRTSSIPPPNIGPSDTRHYQGSNDDGLMPRFLHDLFVNLKKEPSVRDIRVTFVEIYLDTIRDLLVDHRSERSLPIREDAHSVWVDNVRTIQVETLARALEVLNIGRGRQTVGMNALNDESSRSHAIYTMEVSRKFQSEIKKSKVTFVDLAGSERTKKTGVEDLRLQESININMGLSSLGNVINALAEEQRAQRRNSLGSPTSRPSSPDTHIPYRSSKLTRLLRDGLGGNARTLLIACVSPLDSNADETLNTLQFANRTRSIHNKAEKNANSGSRVHPSEMEISRLQDEIKRLMQQISDLEANGRKRDEDSALAEQERARRKEQKQHARGDAEMTTEISIYPRVDAETQDEVDNTDTQRQICADVDTVTDDPPGIPAPVCVDVSVQFGVSYSEGIHVGGMTDPEPPVQTCDVWSSCGLLPQSIVDFGVQFGSSIGHINDVAVATDPEVQVQMNDVWTERSTESTDAGCQYDIPDAERVDTGTATESQPTNESSDASTEAIVETSDASTDLNVETTDASTESAIKTSEAWTESAIETSDASTDSAIQTSDATTETATGTSYASTRSNIETSDASTTAATEMVDASTEPKFATTDASTEHAIETLDSSTEPIECFADPVNVDCQCDFPSFADAATDATVSTVDMSTNCVTAAAVDFGCQAEVSVIASVEVAAATDSKLDTVASDTATDWIPIDFTDDGCQFESFGTVGLKVGMTTDSVPVFVTSSPSTVAKSNMIDSACQCDILCSANAGFILNSTEFSQTLDTSGCDLISYDKESERLTLSNSKDSSTRSECCSQEETAESEYFEVDMCESLDSSQNDDFDCDKSKYCLSPTSSTSTLSDTGSPSISAYVPSTTRDPLDDLSSKLDSDITVFEPEAIEFSDGKTHPDVPTIVNSNVLALNAMSIVSTPTHAVDKISPAGADNEKLIDLKSVVNSPKISRCRSPETIEEEPAKPLGKTSENQFDAGDHVVFVCGSVLVDESIDFGEPNTRSIHNEELLDVIAPGSLLPRALTLSAKPATPIISSSKEDNHSENEADEEQPLQATPSVADFVRIRSPSLGRRLGQQDSVSQKVSSLGKISKRSRSPSNRALRPIRMFPFDGDITGATPVKTAAQAKRLYENLRQLSREEFGHDSDTISNEQQNQVATPVDMTSTVGQLMTETKEFLKRRLARQHRVAQLRCHVRELEELLQVENRAPISELELKAYSERVQEEFLGKLIQQLITLAAERLHTRLKAHVDAEQFMPPLPSQDPTSPFLSLDQCHACTEWFFHRIDDATFFESQILPLIMSGWISLTPRDLEAEHSWLQL